MPTESQRDEGEKEKRKEEKVRMNLTLLCIPRYALANRQSIASFTPAAVKPRSVASHFLPQATLGGGSKWAATLATSYTGTKLEGEHTFSKASSKIVVQRSNLSLDVVEEGETY